MGQPSLRINAVELGRLNQSKGNDHDLTIYTGARPLEIVQLRPCDVENGVILINDHGGKLIKNEASIRDVPKGRPPCPHEDVSDKI